MIQGLVVADLHATEYIHPGTHPPPPTAHLGTAGIGHQVDTNKVHMQST